MRGMWSLSVGVVLMYHRARWKVAHPISHMPTFQLTLAYDGTDFAGWQRQPKKRTIQEELEAALGANDDVAADLFCQRADGRGRACAGAGREL